MPTIRDGDVVFVVRVQPYEEDSEGTYIEGVYAELEQAEGIAASLQPTKYRAWVEPHPVRLVVTRD